jgi:hypothetical protein
MNERVIPVVIGNYNGASIIALPSHPAPRQIELAMNNMVAAPTNPYTGSQLQVLSWPGGDWWSGQIALPKLRPGAEVGVWSAFLTEVRGKANVFPLGDSSYQGCQGNPQGVPLVNGLNSPMATTLMTKGWTPNSFRLLLPGDYLQIGTLSTTPRLHRVLDVVNSDVNGEAAISIWPSIRDITSDGQAINLINPVGLFRMAENKQSMTTDETRFGATSFNVVEAR